MGYTGMPACLLCAPGWLTMTALRRPRGLPAHSQLGWGHCVVTEQSALCLMPTTPVPVHPLPELHASAPCTALYRVLVP